MRQGDDELVRERRMPSFDGATGWINSDPLTAVSLRGNVVVVQFCTYTCINWLRTLPFVRAWYEKYRHQGLFVIGVHTPEFGVEHERDNVRRAIRELAIDYPIAVDSDFAIWNAFSNRYWPAAYFVDAQGAIRAHQFGEGRYAESERDIQRLLLEAGRSDLDTELVHAVGAGIEAPADWEALRSAETYVGYGRGERFASPGGVGRDASRAYTVPGKLSLNDWALSGDWTIGREAARSNDPAGRVAFRFHARDLHLVMGCSGPPVAFRVLIDGEAPQGAHGLDVDDSGYGRVSAPRLYQLLRQPGRIDDRTFEITFFDAGAEVYVFTFG